jgi:hypothetical protein
VLLNLKTGGARRENKTPRAAIGRGESATLGRSLSIGVPIVATRGKPGRGGYSGAPTQIARRALIRISLRRTEGFRGLPASGRPPPLGALGAFRIGILGVAAGNCPKNNPCRA